MAFIVDASIALAWFFKEERTKRTTSLLRRVAEEDAIVPCLWHYEVSSGLLMGIRRGRVPAEAAHDRLARLAQLRLEVDAHLVDRFSTIVQLATETQLSVYDATYLELAMRRNAPLATNDQSLARAATSKKVKLL